MSIWYRIRRDYLMPFGEAFLLAMVIRTFLVQAFSIPTGSMEPTIQGVRRGGDRIFVNKNAYDLKIPFTRVRLAEWGRPERGDLIVFLSPADGKRLVKRVIGVPGDTLEMSDNRLIVNGEPADYEPLGADITCAPA